MGGTQVDSYFVCCPYTFNFTFRCQFRNVVRETFFRQAVLHRDVIIETVF
jgi:hypothetical protein